MILPPSQKNYIERPIFVLTCLFTRGKPLEELLVKLI